MGKGKGRGNKNPLSFSTREERDWVAPECVKGERCVRCGKRLEGRAHAQRYAHVSTRSFPVCSEACERAVERYVCADRRWKKWLYIVLFCCAVAVLLSALAGHEGAVLYVVVIVAGVAFVLFPYPVVSFETFLSCPIRTVTAVFRALGFCLAGFGAALLALGVGA